jgi:starch synthase
VYGGAGVHVEYLSRALASRVDVGVLAFGAPRHDPLVKASYEPWEALPRDREGVALRTMSVGLRMAADVGEVDLVHSHTWYANFPGYLAKVMHGLPHVMTSHSLEPLRPWKAEQLGAGYALSLYCERTAIESADAVIAVSAAMRDDVLGAYRAVDPARVHVIHNGIDAAEYRPDHGTDVLEAFGVDPAAPSVMFIGRITRQKGITHLLDAAHTFDPAAQLVLCAGAPDTPEIGAEMRHRVEALRATRAGVFWIEEMLPRRELVQLLTHADVFVCPSVYEPFGLINLEAMACEVPVVASAVGGIPEIVVDGVTGWLVPYDATDAEGFARGLAERVNALLADPALARRMGEAGRRRVLEHFGWDVIADRTVALYRTLV